MKRFLVLFSVVFVTIACHKDNDDSIPYVPVNATIFLDDPIYSSNPFLVLPSNLNQRVGVNGVVVYKLTSEIYYAFDLLCPYKHERAVMPSVRMTDGDPNLVCPECKSEFSVAVEHGAVIKGPSLLPLKSYQCDARGDGYLYIRN